VRAFAQAPSAESTRSGNGSTFSLGLFAAMLVCAAALLGIGASAASAAPKAGPGFAYLTSFGQGDYDTYTTVRRVLGVDSSGNVMALDQGRGRIRISTFDPTLGATQIAEINTEALGFYVFDFAVDQSDDSVYAADPVFTGQIYRFESDGQPTPTYTQDIGFEVPSGEDLAVDPATHDLLVADGGSESVRRYDSSGTLLETISTPGVAAQLIAPAPDGSFYLSQSEGSSISHFSGSGTLIGTISDQGSIRAITVDPSDSRLVVVLAGAPDKIRTFTSTGAFISDSPAGPRTNLSIAVDGSSGRLYGSEGKLIHVYVPAVLPAIETPVLSDLQRHSVHLSAEVDPGSGPPTGSEAHFEWSDDGGTTWHSTPQQLLTGPTTIEADLTNLKLNLNFLVRAVATNEKATETTAAVAFSTPEVAPEVITGAATDVTEASGVLNGSIDPGGLQTTYYFEYGTTAAHGTKVPAAIEASAGNGREPRAFSRTIEGLQPETEYHFRLVATSALGTTEGSDKTFTTLSAGSVISRAYEQVTPADKHGIAIEPNYGFYAKADGEGMAYVTKGGGASAPLVSRSMTLRGAADWEPGPDLDPPLEVNTAGIITQTTLGLAPDFTQAFVVSNKKLTPDAADYPAASLYIYDVASGEYTSVGSTPPFPLAFNTFAGYGVGGNLVASAPNFDWIVFNSQVPLIEGAPFNALYRWSKADGLEIVSILPGAAETPATSYEPDDYSKVQRWTSADGSKIYFETIEPEPGIYLRENGESKAISVSEVPGEPTGPRPAQILGTSEDGRYAFFGMNEPGVKLTSDAPGEYGDAYRYDASDGSLEFLGTQVLGAGVFPIKSVLGINRDGGTIYMRTPSGTKVWREGDLRSISPIKAGSEQSAASPNGRYLAFTETESSSPLFLYDAVTDEVRCASCLPDGTPAIGRLPNLFNRTIGPHLPQAVTDSGQFFFTSSSRLVAADVNGVDDVYEYKDGSAKLISPGNAPFPATFADISEDGSDVFFTTQQKLVGRDNDGTVDIYDARVGGGLPAQSPLPPQECLRDDCKATPGAGPELPFGGSEALSGPGNVSPPKHKKCAKGKKAKKVNGKVHCVKTHKAKKHKTNKAGKGGNR
jgi:hypothetical protein